MPEGEAIPAQLIVGYGQALSVKLMKMEGSSNEERGESFANEVKRYTKETF